MQDHKKNPEIFFGLEFKTPYGLLVQNLYWLGFEEDVPCISQTQYLLFLSHSLTHSLTHKQTNTYKHTQTHNVYSLSLSHTHTHTHTHTYTSSFVRNLIQKYALHDKVTIAVLVPLKPKILQGPFRPIIGSDKHLFN